MTRHPRQTLAGLIALAGIRSLRVPGSTRLIIEAVPWAAMRSRVRAPPDHRHIKRMPGIQIVEHGETDGEARFAGIVGRIFEGIVAKRLDAPYRAGRRSTWIKVKNVNYSRREALEYRNH